MLFADCVVTIGCKHLCIFIIYVVVVFLQMLFNLNGVAVREKRVTDTSITERTDLFDLNKLMIECCVLR